MSLSDLFGDLGDEEDEDDYRPDANQISDIEDEEELESAPSNSVRNLNSAVICIVGVSSSWKRNFACAYYRSHFFVSVFGTRDDSVLQKDEHFARFARPNLTITAWKFV